MLKAQNLISSALTQEERNAILTASSLCPDCSEFEVLREADNLLGRQNSLTALSLFLSDVSGADFEDIIFSYAPPFHESPKLYELMSQLGFSDLDEDYAYFPVIGSLELEGLNEDAIFALEEKVYEMLLSKTSWDVHRVYFDDGRGIMAMVRSASLGISYHIKDRAKLLTSFFSLIKERSITSLRELEEHSQAVSDLVSDCCDLVSSEVETAKVVRQSARDLVKHLKRRVIGRK